VKPKSARVELVPQSAPRCSFMTFIVAHTKGGGRGYSF
jgi:hypothetical protein